jgi:hypothetical protein
MARRDSRERFCPGSVSLRVWPDGGVRPSELVLTAKRTSAPTKQRQRALFRPEDPLSDRLRDGVPLALGLSERRNSRISGRTPIGLPTTQSSRRVIGSESVTRARFPAQHGVSEFLAGVGAIETQDRLTQSFEPCLMSDPAPTVKQGSS